MLPTLVTDQYMPPVGTQPPQACTGAAALACALGHGSCGWQPCPAAVTVSCWSRLAGKPAASHRCD